jgi:hypothetical protein
MRHRVVAAMFASSTVVMDKKSQNRRVYMQCVTVPLNIEWMTCDDEQTAVVNASRGKSFNNIILQMADWWLRLLVASLSRSK